MKVSLRDYQGDAVAEARALIKAGKKNILIVAPTGAGKTVIAAAIVELSQQRGSHTAFLVDRISLIDQTSATFDRYGLEHGVLQADHWRFRPSCKTQLCSQQTVSRRKRPDAQLVVVDEAHTNTKLVIDWLGERRCVGLGLTATPFTKGLGKTYDAVVNVTTTNKLIADGWLVPFRIFACEEPDMEGVKVVSGEWDRVETQSRALQVVGDVVQEYMQHGEGRKFICSAVDTAHVEELQRQFLAAGINAATYTYKDRKEDRSDTVNEFRKPNSAIRGLITVTAASKGFDVPDIGCVIMARPLRSSLAEHIQFLGRGLRICEGKKDCLVLDHSGNCARFWAAMEEFFEIGCTGLDSGEKKPKPKPEKEEAKPMKCPTCGHLHKPRPFCPACGFEYPKRSTVEHVPGALKEILAAGNKKAISVALWPQIVAIAREKKGDDGRGMALALYKQITGTWPVGEFADTKPAEPTLEVRNKVRSLNIAYQRARAKQTEAAPA